MYKFVKGSSSGSNRLFVEGTTSGYPERIIGPPIVTELTHTRSENLQAIHTHKRLSTEVLGSSLESTKTSRRGQDGSRRITTRILRKVTTLTRGEERSSLEDLTQRAQQLQSIQGVDEVDRIADVKRKRVKVSLFTYSYPLG